MNLQDSVCETVGCIHTAYGSSRLCGKCIGGTPPSKRGPVTVKELAYASHWGGAHAVLTRQRLIDNGQPLRELPESLYGSVTKALRTEGLRAYKKPTPNPQTVFLSYATEQRANALKIHSFLTELSHRPWLDVFNLTLSSSHQLKPTIETEIQRTSFLVACLSAECMSPGRFVLEEFALALNRARETPYLFVIPVVLDASTIPEEYLPYHPIDFSRSDALSRLALTLEYASADYL